MVVGFVGKEKLNNLIKEVIVRLMAEKNRITLSEGEDDVVGIIYDRAGTPYFTTAVTGIEDIGEGIQRTVILRTTDPVNLEEIAENFLKNV